MRIEPSFSICIPVFNHGAYIGSTIQSVLDQSYQNFEIIVADNASTDNTVEVVEQFDDPRIKLIRNRYNIGFAPNLQRVTMHARCDFINLLSSDDQMKPDALETYAEVIIRNAEDAHRIVLFSQSENFDNQNRITGYTIKAPDGFYNRTVSFLPPSGASDQLVPYETFDGHEVLVDSLRRLRTFAPFLCIVYARPLWETVEGYNAVRVIGPDKYFNYKLLHQNPLVIYVPRVLYRYRDYQSVNRATQQTTLKQIIDDYLYTIEYGDDELSQLGLSRNDLIDTFLDTKCLKEGLSQLGYRNYSHALRLLAFAISSHPTTVLRKSKAYLLFILLLTGPLSTLIAPRLLALYHWLKRTQRTQLTTPHTDPEM